MAYLDGIRGADAAAPRPALHADIELMPDESTDQGPDGTRAECETDDCAERFSLPGHASIREKDVVQSARFLTAPRGR